MCINCESANECGDDSVAQTCATKTSVYVNLHTCNGDVDCSILGHMPGTFSDDIFPRFAVSVFEGLSFCV